MEKWISSKSPMAPMDNLVPTKDTALAKHRLVLNLCACISKLWNSDNIAMCGKEFIYAYVRLPRTRASDLHLRSSLVCWEGWGRSLAHGNVQASVLPQDAGSASDDYPWPWKNQRRLGFASTFFNRSLLEYWRHISSFLCLRQAHCRIVHATRRRCQLKKWRLHERMNIAAFLASCCSLHITLTFGFTRAAHVVKIQHCLASICILGTAFYDCWMPTSRSNSPLLCRNRVHADHVRPTDWKFLAPTLTSPKDLLSVHRPK